MNLSKEITIRRKKGVAASILGFFVNIFLGAGKLILGILSGSVSIISDGINNLFDSVNSAIAVLSFVLSGKKADREHPYGHARYEYIASLIIGTVVMVVGFQLIFSSIQKIISPSSADFSPIIVLVLSLSILVKLAMAVFYRIVSKKIRSTTLKASAFDSLVDCVVTAAVLGSFFVTAFSGFAMCDGIVGLFVSLFILYGGAGILKETIYTLLGTSGDEKLAKQLNDLVLSGDMVVGVHDLNIHEYGTFCIFASIHAEFDKNLTIISAHDIIDKLEESAMNDYGVQLVVHCDPIDTSDEVANLVRRNIYSVLAHYKKSSIHDLKINHGQKTVFFHVKLPSKYQLSRDILSRQLCDIIKNDLPNYSVNTEYDIIW